MISFVIGLIGGILGVYGFFFGPSVLITVGGLLCVGTILFDLFFGGLNNITTPAIAAVIGFLLFKNWNGILLAICVETLLSSIVGLVMILSTNKRK